MKIRQQLTELWNIKVFIVEITSDASKTRPAGEDVALPCQTVLDNVDVTWLRGQEGLTRGQERLLPKVNGSLSSPGLRHRLTVRLVDRCTQELLLRNATANDTNIYTCIDGHDRRSIIRLRVLGTCYSGSSSSSSKYRLLE